MPISGAQAHSPQAHPSKRPHLRGPDYRTGNTSLLCDNHGLAITEFALIAPVLILMMIGLFDLSYNMYTNSMLHGAIQKAARDSTIEGADNDTVDKTVTDAIQTVVSNAEISFKRNSYSDFSDVSRPESYDDLNKDGVCNDGEPFEDSNGNGAWDEDKGSSGQGKSRDAVHYEVSVSYARMLPLPNFVGVSDKHETTAATVLRNQPYVGHADSAKVGNCS